MRDSFFCNYRLEERTYFHLHLTNAYVIGICAFVVSLNSFPLLAPSPCLGSSVFSFIFSILLPCTLLLSFSVLPTCEPGFFKTESGLT